MVGRKSVLAGGVKAGAIFPTNADGDVFVLEVIDANHVRICFLEYPYERIVKGGNLIRGGVSNPIRPNVCGVGYVGDGPHRAKTDHKPNPTHQTWHDMLKRCYTPRTVEGARVYAGATVNPHWFNFQNFAPWYEERLSKFGPVDFRWELDKDLLFPGNREYGPERCSIVPKPINTLFTDHAFARGEYPLGVSYRNRKFQASISSFGKNRRIGSYDTIREAQIAYWSEKVKVIQVTALHYCPYMPEPLALRLINFTYTDALAYYGQDAVLWND